MRRFVLPPHPGFDVDPFTRSLLTGAGPAAAHLPPLPLDAAGLARAADAARRTLAPPPGPLVDAIVAYQREHGLGGKAEANAAALARGALAVVTGQQPGLFGGPLLALHKAAGAIAFARRVEEAGGGRVVPVFWLASEDHDFDEANRAYVEGANRAASLSLDLRGDGRSVRDLPLPDDAVERVLRELRDVLGPTERAAQAVMDATVHRPTDLASWSVSCLRAWMGDSGLVVVEPHVLAPWAGAAYARLARDADAIGDAVREEGERLRADRLAAPLAPTPGSAPLFLRDAPHGRRLRVSFDGAAVLLRGEPASIDRPTLEARVRDEPSLASGDVVGRVFVQNATLPVLAYVGGPTELAYLAQVRAAHAALGVRFPLAVPRPQATWIDAETLRALERAHVSPADVLAHRDPERAATDDPSARALAASVARCRSSLASTLRPRGRPQERVLSPASLAARYGVEAVREGLSLLDPCAPGHQILEVG